MSKISVITGGFGGMGADTAKLVGKYSDVVLIDEYEPREKETVEMLRDLGIKVKTYIADVADRVAIRKIAQETAASGEIVNVVHTAGYSPHMVQADRLFEVNLTGTIIVTEEFFSVLGKGSNLINFASMAAHFMPSSPDVDALIDDYLLKGAYDTMMAAFKERAANVPADRGGPTGMAYTLSKYFVIRYSKANALRFGKKGIRINSLSPGSYLTFMRSFEQQSSDRIIGNAPISRYGIREEIAATAAYLCEATYITGSDILADGGVIAGRMFPQIP
jgi:NAD(P)-dependent dehydrogenase (short-subunit alcohol dehydrogenase family)